MIEDLASKITILSKAAFDKRSPLRFKLLLIVIVAYLLSPIDIIPDFIPVLGLVDEAILIPILLKLAYKMIPETLLIEYEQQTQTDNSGDTKLKYLGLLIVITLWAVFFVMMYYLINSMS